VTPTEYLRHECDIFDKYPEVYEAFPDKKKPHPRSENTITDLQKKLRAFFNWAIDAGYMEKNPFDGYHIKQQVFGDPIFLTKEEIHALYAKDFSKNPKMAQQRDIFVFQCNFGCRVGDLMKLKKKDVVNGRISYIPSKTIKHNAKTVTVPLNDIAKEIIARYKDYPGDELLPFTFPQEYNRYIKSALQEAKITRLVTVLDPLTRTQKKVPINTIGASHMARRSFAGNLYKQVSDPNLIGSLTGHTEGSHAFARYRKIDDEMKQDLVNLLG